MKKSVLFSILTAGVLSGALFAGEMDKSVPPVPTGSAVTTPEVKPPAKAKTHKKHHKTETKKKASKSSEVKPNEAMPEKAMPN
jgi:hypothetical protein